MDRVKTHGQKAPWNGLLLAALLLAGGTVSANNPCIHDAYTADPTPLWVNNTMYIYSSHDANFTSGQTGYNIPNDVLMHSTDLVNWEDDGEIVTSGVSNPWAPAVVYLNGTYYLYYTAGGGSIGVLTSTSPYGPFAGGNKSLVNGSTSDPGMGGNLLDPAVLVDTTGQAYLYFGGGGPGTGAGSASRVIKLNANMISVAGSGSGVPAPNFFEASGINLRNGVYYHSYSSDPAFGMNIEYIMANNPLFTSPTIPSQPIAVANGGAANCYNNQGGGFVNIGTTWYAAYFNRALANANGLPCSQGVYQRSVCFDQMNFNSDGTIQEITQTSTGPTALHNVDPYSTQAAACMADQGGVAPSGLSEKGVQSETCSEGGRDLTAIAASDWIRIRNLAFGSCTASFTARVASTVAGGSIQIRLDSTTGTLVGTCSIPNTGGMQTWQNVTCTISGATGLHDLYFVFAGSTFNFQSYSFVACGNPTPSFTAIASRTPSLTATRTATVLSTSTRTATLTGTRTQTATATPTASPSKTVTATPSKTATATSTLSSTATATPTLALPTATVTRTNTTVPPSLTASPVPPTGSPSATVVGSPVSSLTASPGLPSATASPTTVPLTATATASPSRPSATATPTAVPPTATLTATPFLPSATATPTAVPPTPTATLTRTAAPTATLLPTAQPRVISSISPATLSTSGGATIVVIGTGFQAGDQISVGGVALQTTFISSTQLQATAPAMNPGTVVVTVQSPGGAQASGSETLTVSSPKATATRSPTAVPSNGTPNILKAVPGPNPNPTGISVQLDGRADYVDVKVYSTSLRLVAEDAVGTGGPGWLLVPLPPGFASYTAAGTYYYQVQAFKSGVGSKPVTGTIVILH